MYGFGTYGQQSYGSITGSKKSYFVSVTVGTFSISTLSAGLLIDRKISSYSGSFILTGINNTLKRDLLISSSAVSFSLSGPSLAYKKLSILSAAAGNLALSPGTTALLRGRKIAAGYSSFAASVYTASFSRGYKAALSSTGFTLDGIDISYKYIHRLNTSKAVFELIGTITKLNGRIDRPGAPRIQLGEYFIDLPFCQGLTESFLPDFGTSKKLFSSGRITRELKGFYYAAQLDYSKAIDINLFKYLQKLYKMRDTSFIFYPRNNMPYLSYQCELDPETDFTIAQLPFHQGHKGIIIKLAGLTRLKQIDFEGGSALVDTQDQPILDDSGNAILGGLF